MTPELALPSFIQVMMSSEMMFADAIILQNVEPEDVKNFNFIAGTTPFIQKCLRLVRPR